MALAFTLRFSSSWCLALYLSPTHSGPIHVRFSSTAVAATAAQHSFAAFIQFSSVLFLLCSMCIIIIFLTPSFRFSFFLSSDEYTHFLVSLSVCVCVSFLPTVQCTDVFFYHFFCSHSPSVCLCALSSQFSILLICWFPFAVCQRRVLWCKWRTRWIAVIIILIMWLTRKHLRMIIPSGNCAQEVRKSLYMKLMRANELLYSVHTEKWTRAWFVLNVPDEKKEDEWRMLLECVCTRETVHIAYYKYFLALLLDRFSPCIDGKWKLTKR